MSASVFITVRIATKYFRASSQGTRVVISSWRSLLVLSQTCQLFTQRSVSYLSPKGCAEIYKISATYADYANRTLTQYEVVCCQATCDQLLRKQALHRLDCLVSSLIRWLRSCLSDKIKRVSRNVKPLGYDEASSTLTLLSRMAQLCCHWRTAFPRTQFQICHK